MSVLAVGASYRTAPADILDRLAIATADLPALLTRVLAGAHVDEAVVLSTCNRVEVYAAVTAFHGGLADIRDVLAAHSGLDADRLAEHLYVHFDGAAVAHAFAVAAGLDSMVMGEAQILGQMRDAYAVAADADATGRLLHELMQRALRVGKRARAETGIDRAGGNTVTTGLAVAAGLLPGGLTERPVLVLGAGAMGALSLAALARSGAGPVHVANRDPGRAQRLAEGYGARAVPMSDLPDVLGAVDLVVAVTAARTPPLTAELLAPALRTRATRGPDGPLVLLDLAVPRNVAPEVGHLPAVVVDLEAVGRARAGGAATGDEQAVRRIVAEECADFLAWCRGSTAAPAVAALRGRAERLVAAELRRLRRRRPDLTEPQQAEVAHTLHRVVQQLLHPPTVRMRQLVGEPGGERYADLLRELFGVEPTDPVRLSDGRSDAGKTCSSS
jgi:glutamyl-tRNA reductase